jgi:glycine cleavage system H protein
MATMRRFMPITTRLLQKISNKSRHFFTIKTLNDKKIYTESDEWLLKLDDYTHKLGISNFASEQLGDLVYVEYCLEPGEEFEKGDDIVIIESVKASNSIKAPFDGKLVENNSDIEDSPEKVSDMPEDDNTAWFCKIDILKEHGLI